jgi:predicted O-methyltransferase YrrM
MRLASCIPILKEYFSGKLPLRDKLRLFAQVVRSKRKIVSATGFLEQLTMISALLKSSVPGVVVECGTYQGGSAASLSLACRLSGRRLFVFDSFEGLPLPSQEDARHNVLIAQEVHVYAKGNWSGSLELVKHNIEHYGAIEVCTFVKGYFQDSLPRFSEPVAFVFCDVDLKDSARTCIGYLWPMMTDGATFFTHEAHHMEIAELFFDRVWWKQEMSCVPPGLVGAGSGLGLTPQPGGFLGSCIGYTVKNPTLRTESLEIGVRERLTRPVSP